VDKLAYILLSEKRGGSMFWSKVAIITMANGDQYEEKVTESNIEKYLDKLAANSIYEFDDNEFIFTKNIVSVKIK
jgi:hypothetical protein